MNSPIIHNQVDPEILGNIDSENAETTSLLSRPLDGDNSNHSRLSSNSPSNRRRLWPDIRHYDTIDMTHLIVTDGEAQPTAAVYDTYTFSPPLDVHDYHDLISHRLSLAHGNNDRDDTLLILGDTAQSSLLDLEQGQRLEAFHAISDSLLSNNQNLSQTLAPSSQGQTIPAEIPTPIPIPNNGNTENNPTGEDQPDYVMDTVNRLRCIFSCVTLPIVPIGSVLSITLFYVIYAAFVLDVHQTCSHPLKLYAIYSIALFLYIPQHKNIKTYLFRYNRDRDGPHAPIGVKVYDQLFYLICLIYLSGGMDLVQSCVEDTVQNSDSMNGSPAGDSNNTTTVSSCYATCPHLYDATKLYVTILQLFAFAMLLPIVFLPCIYAYIIRRVHHGVESILLQSILRRGDAFRSSTDDGTDDGVTVQDIMDHMQKVRLAFVSQGADMDRKKVQIIHYSKGVDKMQDEQDDSNMILGKIKEWEDVKDCCICMSDLIVSQENYGADITCTSHDVASSSLVRPLLAPIEEKSENRDNIPGSVRDDIIVQTKCGHLFHQTCLGGWLGGGWDDSTNAASVHIQTPRRARRRCCPLCREDLTPAP